MAAADDGGSTEGGHAVQLTTLRKRAREQASKRGSLAATQGVCSRRAARLGVEHVAVKVGGALQRLDRGQAEEGRR